MVQTGVDAVHEEPFCHVTSPTHRQAFCKVMCLLHAQGLPSIGLSAVQTGMDNVRNMTGSPIAGVDPHELLDVRPLNDGASLTLLCIHSSLSLPYVAMLVAASCFVAGY